MLASFAVGLLGGAWAVLHAQRRMSWRLIASEILGSGCIGLGLSLLLYKHVGNQEFGDCFLIGLALLIGMGGRTTAEKVQEAVVFYVTRGVLNPRRARGLEERKEQDWGGGYYDRDRGDYYDDEDYGGGLDDNDSYGPRKVPWP